MIRVFQFRSACSWLSVLAVSCTSFAPPASTTRQPDQPPASVQGDAGVLWDRYLREMDAAYDIHRLALLTEQSPPHRHSPTPLGSPFPGASYRQVRAYSLEGHPWGFESLDAPVPGVGAVADDGTLRPSVLLPGKALTDAQISRLIRAAEMRQPSTSAVDCFEPLSHAYVFSDERERPIAQILLSLSCRTRIYAPVDSGQEVASARLSDVGLESVRSLCEELQLGRCFLADAALTKLVRAKWLATRLDRTSIQHRILPQPLRTAATKSLNEFSPMERRELCAWSFSFIDQRLAPPRSHGFFALDDNGNPTRTRGWAIRTLNWSECVQEFPRCDVQFNRVLPCVEAVQRVTPFLAGEPPECEALRACIWGFEIHETSGVKTDRARVPPATAQ